MPNFKILIRIIIAQQHPDNYGWYQCRFHVVAGQIYDAGGVAAMTSLWSALQKQKEKLDDAALNELLAQTHPALKDAVLNWDKK